MLYDFISYFNLFLISSILMQENKSIEQLENDYWPDQVYPTGLVERCHLYRKVPIKDLTIEQIRTLIGQQIGLEYLLPKALAILKSDILAEGDFYAGDLLSAVVNVKSCSDLNLKEAYRQLLRQKIDNIKNSNEDNEHGQLLKQIDAFFS